MGKGIDLSIPTQLAYGIFSRTVREMKKALRILMTILVMLALSRFIVRLVDATVQIDDDIGALLLLLALVNTAVGFAMHALFTRLDSRE